ncbi:MAG: hypothetical protein EBR01_07140 [Proteobacteria bacterium]|nr:hypothetical protein [Pseudomonadota bacterium]
MDEVRETGFISKDTKLFVSLAEMPGNTGTVWFNHMFTQYKIDAIYKAFRVGRTDFEKAFHGIRALGVAGGAISMPFKKLAADMVDEMVGVSKDICVINTFLRDVDGRLKGFNTDYVAALKSLPEKTESVYLLGSGGVAASVAWAIRNKQNMPLTVISRQKNRSCIPKVVDWNWVCWDEMNKLPPPETLINCTPLGMIPSLELKIPNRWWTRIKTAIDLTYRPEGNFFSKQAGENAIHFIDGKQFANWQAVEQFKIYTGIEIKN